VPQVEVSFDIDANGILNVSAKDLASGRKQGITITASNKLSKDEVQRMVHQAEEFASKDRERTELIEAKNQAESLAYEADRLLADSKEKLEASDADQIRERTKELRAVVQDKEATPSRIKEKTEELTRALHGVAQKLYRPPSGPSGEGPAADAASSPPPPGGGSGTGPVDADFKVVHDDGEKGEP